MANYYYSGQGRLYYATRNATTGAPQGFTLLGNCPSLELSIEVTKFEHKESMTGQRAIDLTIIQEKKANFTITCESLDTETLAMGFWGQSATTAAGTGVTTNLTAKLDKRNILDHPKVSSVAVTGSGGTPTYVLDTDYTLDAEYGVIVPLSTGAITADLALEVTYDHAAYTSVEAFTETSMERYLRFEGLNTIDGKEVVVDLYKANIDPLSGFGLINEELASYELTGSVLYDELQSGTSKFFRERFVS